MNATNDSERMPRNVRAGLEFLPRRLKLTGDARTILTIRAADPPPEGLSSDNLLAVWFHDALSPSTVMLRSVKLVEASIKSGCGLAFVGIHRRNIPRELADKVELFVC